MEKSLKYYLSILCVAILLISCNNEEYVNGKTQKRILAEKLFNEGAHLYQGSPKSMTRIQKAIDIDPTYDEAVRELSVAYLKRGIPHIWKKHIDKAVDLNPEMWMGYRGYNYLWFYRDYKKAIRDFDEVDRLTPNFIDAPQGHSVDYWRGVAYLGLKNYEKSIAYFDKEIKQETEKFSENSVEVTSFLYRGIAYYQMENYEEAKNNFNKLLKHSYNKYADGKYFLAQILKKEGKIKEAKEMLQAALQDFEEGYVNKRPYVESMHELYLEDYNLLLEELKQ
ncbi:tetratricopeptide repeat protein [Tenacibaculum sp. M341]|uniref:tetratricopeptide repeat protein n=1 Tax=Tenacibaculum sp. M341 TaxID=2530339 RepID=UPI00104980D5|nr:tetratricopeptide repeat protein [Tenacibaculum sp. M341]TCI92260.1 tetratricopeptide repeat protein [Tenacibaculum sp. M341]